MFLVKIALVIFTVKVVAKLDFSVSVFREVEMQHMGVDDSSYIKLRH